MAASEIGADILVTARATLLTGRPFETPKITTVASPREAIPMLGLYIRSRGNYFVTKAARFSFITKRGLYWQRAAELYIPNLLILSTRSVPGATATCGSSRPCIRRSLHGPCWGTV